MMMLNKMFMFHYQLDQNTGCKVKSVVNMNRQPTAILLASSLLLGYVANDVGLTLGELPQVYPKTLFFHNPG